MIYGFVNKYYSCLDQQGFLIMREDPGSKSICLDCMQIADLLHFI